MLVPSGDQRGRSAYPLSETTLVAAREAASAIQTSGLARSPVLEKKAAGLESGDQAGLLSSRDLGAPGGAISTSSPPVRVAMWRSVGCVPTVPCTQARRSPSCEMAMPEYVAVRLAVARTRSTT